MLATPTFTPMSQKKPLFFINYPDSGIHYSNRKRTGKHDLVCFKENIFSLLQHDLSVSLLEDIFGHPRSPGASSGETQGSLSTQQFNTSFSDSSKLFT
jgi:hypothetical protein